MECEDKMDIFDEDLEEMPVEVLRMVLEMVSGCNDCSGCEGQIKMLERMIAEKGQ